MEGLDYKGSEQGAGQLLPNSQAPGGDRSEDSYRQKTGAERSVHKVPDWSEIL